MKLSECHLILEHKESEGEIVLQFKTLHLGIRRHLCTIRKKSATPMIQTESEIYPNFLTRASYRMIYGVKTFTHDYAVIGDDNQENYIAFFRCTDRRGRNRIFTCASEMPGRDAGGRFFIKKEDYDTITQTLTSIEEDTGELGTPFNGGQHPSFDSGFYPRRG